MKITKRRIVIGLIVLALAVGIWRALAAKRAQQLAATDAAQLQAQLELSMSLLRRYAKSPKASPSQAR
jgi:hypothetical protein